MFFPATDSKGVFGGEVTGIYLLPTTVRKRQQGWLMHWPQIIFGKTWSVKFQPFLNIEVLNSVLCRSQSNCCIPARTMSGSKWDHVSETAHESEAFKWIVMVNWRRESRFTWTIFWFFLRTADVSVVKKYYSSNKQGNQVHFFWQHSHIVPNGTTEIARLPSKGDTSSKMEVKG